MNEFKNEKTMRKLLLMFTIITLASCSSDDDTPILEDYTNVDVIRELMIGTWDATHLNDNGKWVKLDHNETFIFNSRTYYYESTNKNGEIDLELSGEYKINPATERYNATIDLYTSGVKAPMQLILKNHNKGVVEMGVSTSSKVFDFRYKKR